MLRTILTTLMLAFVAFVTFTPSVSATCIDANPDDDGVGTVGCNIPVAGTCKVLGYGTVVDALTPSCVEVVCVKECVPHWPPYDCVQDCDGTEK